MNSGVLGSLTSFVRKCRFIEELHLNLSHCVCLTEGEEQSQENTYYGKLTFRIN